MEEDDEIVIIKLKGKIDTAAIKELIDFQVQIINEVGKPKMEYEVLEISDEFKNEIRALHHSFSKHDSAS